MGRRQISSAVVAVALAAAACSSSTSSNDSKKTASTSEPTTRTTTGVTDKSVKVGGLATLSGSIISFSGLEMGAQARFARVNREGGVNGRAIDFIGMQDDASVADRNLAGAQKLIQDGVFAVVPVMTAEFGGSPLLTQQRVPYFGWGIATGFCDNDVAFSFSGCLTKPNPVRPDEWGRLLGAQIGGAKGKTLALIAEDSDLARSGMDNIVNSFKPSGYRVVYKKASVPASPAIVADFSPFVNELLTSNDGKPPDVIELGVAPGNVFGLSAELRKQGYRGVVTNAVAYDPRLVSNPDLEGQYVYLQFAPFENAKTVPAIQQMIDDINAFAPGTVLSQPVAAGYWIADLFVAGLEKTGRDLTRERFLSTLNHDFHWDVPDAIGRPTWPALHHYTTPCGSLVQIKDKHYVPTTDRIACN